MAKSHLKARRHGMKQDGRCFLLATSRPVTYSQIEVPLHGKRSNSKAASADDRRLTASPCRRTCRVLGQRRADSSRLGGEVSAAFFTFSPRWLLGAPSPTATIMIAVPAPNGSLPLCRERGTAMRSRSTAIAIFKCLGCISAKWHGAMSRLFAYCLGGDLQ
jgi:hypothetical protein